MSINVYKNGKLRWRSSSKTSEELLEEERQRRAEQEAQTANTQSQLAGFGNTTSPAATAPKQAVESPMSESEPLVDPNILSDFVGAAKEKWQNRNNNQTLPSTPKENIFQRMGRGIKETIEGFGDSKELRDYKRMTRDMERASREMQANQIPFEDLVNMPTPTTVPLESFAPIDKGSVVLNYPKRITMPGINPNSKVYLSAVEPEKALNPQEGLENVLLADPELAELSEEELSRVGSEINSEYQKVRQQAMEAQKRQSAGIDTGDMVLQGSAEKSNLKEHLRDSLSKLTDSLNVKKQWHDFQETGFNKEDDLNLKEEMKEHYEILVNNKTDYSTPMTIKEKLTDSLVQKGFKFLFPSASDVYTDGMTDFSRARNNPNADVLDNMNTLDEATKKALYNYGVKADERGVYYDSDSEISKKFANSPEVRQFFEENEQAIKQGEKNKENFDFEASMKDLFFNKDKADRFGSLQHAKMIDAYYDENGRKHGKFIDNIDYERRYPDKPKDVFKTYINNHGFNMQEKGNFENYYIVMDILLDDSIEESKKKNLLQKILHK